MVALALLYLVLSGFQDALLWGNDYGQSVISPLDYVLIRGK